MARGKAIDLVEGSKTYGQVVPIKETRGRKKKAVIITTKKKKKSMSIKKLAYQVAQINCEKKEVGVYNADLSNGQIYTDGSAIINSGHYLTAGLTFNASNGTTDITRIGDEVMISGLYNEFQFQQQANATQKIRGKIYFFTPRIGSTNVSVTVGTFLNPNGFIFSATGNNVYDYMSSRNMDYIRDYKVLRIKRFTISPDLASTTQKMITTLKCGLKFKKPWKARFNSAGQLVYGQIWMLLVFDSGNSGTVAAGAGANTTSIAKTDVLSGVTWSYFSKTYFMDP